MAYDEETLNRIFDKTNGYCHICDKRLSWKNYGSKGDRGAWEVDHSIALANGGTHHLNNLFPACVPCNNEKGTLHKNTIRKRKGYYDRPQEDESCFLTTACVTHMGLPDNCRELQILRLFRDEYVAQRKRGKELLKEYYRIAPSVVKSINKLENARAVYLEMYVTIRRAVELIESGERMRALKLYLRMTKKYSNTYL